MRKYTAKPDPFGSGAVDVYRIDSGREHVASCRCQATADYLVAALSALTDEQHQAALRRCIARADKRRAA